MFDVSSYGRRYWRTIDCLMQSCQPSMLDSQASECKCQGLQTASDMHSMTQIWPKATSIAIKLCPCQREGKGWTVVLGCVVSLSYIRHSKNGNGLYTHSDSLVKCRPFCTCAQGTSRIGAALVITNLRNMQPLPLCHKYRRKNVCILYVQSLELSCKRWPKHVRCTWIEVWKLHELRTLWLLPQKPKTVFTSTTWNFSWRA